MQLVLVRHALPQHIPAATGGGPADPALTELGERQADRLVNVLGADVAALYCSPMARARATAAPLAAAIGRDPEIVEDLREYDAESPEYVPVHEMARLDPPAWQRMLDGLLPAHVDVPAFTARVDAALERIVAAHPGRATVVVVAHAGVASCSTGCVLLRCTVSFCRHCVVLSAQCRSVGGPRSTG
ncbi:MAG: histidine phosphatase family protein, partial [Pseudonocardia sp.]|nr:histidine phosphatase family protein [Pseudonocardia sp.]